MNWSFGGLAGEVPLGVVTVTSTVPVPDGAVTVRLVGRATLIEVPGFEPEVDGRGAGEAGAGHRDRGPAGRWATSYGLTAVTVGSAVAGVGDWPGVRRRARPLGGGHGHRDRAGPRRDDDGEAGGAADADEVPAVAPKSTVVEPETKPVPVTVTELPPAGGPLFGLTKVTVGGAL